MWFHSYVGYKTERNKLTKKTEKQTKTQIHRLQYGGYHTEIRAREAEKGGGHHHAVMEGDSTLGGEHTGDASQNCALETWVILLTNVTLINLIHFLKEGNFIYKELNMIIELNTSPGWLALLDGHHPAKRKVTGSIPSWGTCLGCKFGPKAEHIWKVTDWCFSLTLMFLSLSFSLPPPLSKIKIK